MGRFLRRLGIFAVTLLGASILIFAVTAALPGDIVQVLLGTDTTPEAVARLRREFGLDRPLPVRYLEWLGGVLTDRLLLNQHLGKLLWLLFALICAQQGLSYVTALQLQKVSGRLQADAGAELYAHLQALPLQWHNARQRGDVLALLYVDIHRIGRYVTGTLLPLLPLLFTLVGALAMMLYLAPLIAVMVAVLMPLLFLAVKLVGR